MLCKYDAVMFCLKLTNSKTVFVIVCMNMNLVCMDTNYFLLLKVNIEYNKIALIWEI